MHITELSRVTGASADELRYMERKGFLGPAKVNLGKRQVREYRDGDIRKVQLIIKYRRQGFTWDVAAEKALKEMENPPLL